MGYYTRYTLTQEKNPITPEELAEYISGDQEMSYSMTPDGRASERSKWYEHDSDMVELSAKFPETIFKLHGEGEEAGDVWDKFFTRGKKVHETRLKADLPQPDLDKL